MSLLIICTPEDQLMAQSVETLIMPGEVIQGHVDIEGDCAGCHKRFDRPAQRGLCMDCHEDVAADISASQGFHGKSNEAKEAQCSTCHTDHQGRSANIVQLDELSFDHGLTNFELLGKHQDVECNECHTPDLRHREAPNDCNSCHTEDDIHFGSLGEECADCHNSSDWTDTRFDHDTTSFPLLGMHQETECAGCHEDQSFTETPTSCIGCHADDDIHEGGSGEQCNDCHNPTSWTDTSFDHSRDTTFPLLGQHNLLTCNDCHTDDPFNDSLQTDCVGCHLDDDDHKGHNGTECADCHSNDEWEGIIFDHARDTEFLLNGSHREVACNDCHIEPLYESSPGQSCNSCHVDDDVHSGSQGDNCQNCHTENTWTEVQNFDHGLTNFPLLGEHDNIECESCHETQVFSDTSSDCASCHIDEDPHEGVFTDTCETCHNPVAWDLWMFDHNSQTDFVINGAHIDVTCESCHQIPLESLQQSGDQCGDCHRTDDVHDGEFGFDCGRCHSDQTFKDVRSFQ